MATIQETFTLPSHGVIYKEKINPEVTLRSMTTMEEMMSQSPTTTPYLAMCDIIEKCLVKPLGMEVADLCLGDYQFLMHKLRIVTFGSDYKMTTRCQYCNTVEDSVIDLETLELNEYDEEYDKLFTITLPITKKEIKLKYQTPRMLERISKRKQEFLKKNPDAYDPTFQYTLEELIDTIDGEVLNSVRLEKFVQDLPLKDAKKIFQQGEKINDKIGLDDVVITTCQKCGNDYASKFRTTSEFFNPEID